MRTIEIVCRNSGKEVLRRFKGIVGGNIAGEFSVGEPTRQRVTMYRPTRLQEMVEQGGVPDSPVLGTTPGRTIGSDGNWQPNLPSKKERGVRT